MTNSPMVGERFRDFLKSKKNLSPTDVPEVVNKLLDEARGGSERRSSQSVGTRNRDSFGAGRRSATSGDVAG